MKHIITSTLLILLFTTNVFSEVVRPSDFTFVGGFRMPTGLSFPNGLTHRYKDGEFYLYSVSTNTPTRGALVEFQPPETLSQGLPFTQSTIQQSYGDVFQDTLRDVVSNGSGGTPPYIGIDGGATPPSGILWDEQDQRMYWTKVVNYNTTTTTSDTGIGYSVLDDSTHTGTGVGAWKLSPTVAQGGRSSRWGFSMVHIPVNFANMYLGGRRLGVGFGGGVSIVSNGPPSIGPTLFAIKPLSTETDPVYDYIADPPLELMSSLIGEGRGIRNPLYPGMIHRDDPYNGQTDRWFESDMSKYAVWINGTNKQGIIVFTQMGAGNASTVVTTETTPSLTSFSVADKGDISVGDYIRVATDYNPVSNYPFEACFVSSVDGNKITVHNCRAGNNSATTTLTGTPVADGFVMSGNWYMGGGDAISRVWNPWYIYDPADIAAVAQDHEAHPPQNVLPSFNDNVPFPGLTYPGGGREQGSLYNHEYNPRGATFDPISNRLYVATYASGGGASVYVYQFNDSSGATIPGSCGPSNGRALSSAPVTNLCSAGTASSVSGAGPWSWTCAGSGGGSTANCSATLLEIPSGGASAAVACSAIAGFR